jgi:hypothetical protein
MRSTITRTSTTTYTIADVENVMCNVMADLVMIAASTKAMTESTARDYAHDIECLAKKDYLAWVDVTLLVDSVELRAVRYNFLIGGEVTSASRPGGVRWPESPSGKIRIVLRYTAEYTDEKKAANSSRLRISWSSSSADTSHTRLNSSDGPGYSSNGFGTDRKDFK